MYSNNLTKPEFWYWMVAFPHTNNLHNEAGCYSNTVGNCCKTNAHCNKNTNNNGEYGGDCGFHCWYVTVCQSKERNFVWEKAECSETTETKYVKLLCSEDKTYAQTNIKIYTQSPVF